MTTALATLLVCVLVAGLVVAVATYLWVNRTPSTNERFDRYGRVPLFGVEVGTGPSPATAVPAKSDAPKQEDEARVDSFAAPTADPAASSIRNTTDGVADARPARVETLPDKPPAVRPGGNGWGDTPGWPADPRRMRHTPPAPARIAQATPPYSGIVRQHLHLDHDQPAAAANGNGVYANGVPGSMVEGHALRFSIPAEGTLQFLPGRLEIGSGMDAGREIRFVRVPGPNGTEVTFGRNEGPLYRHIQLRDGTVSREHARMTLLDSAWHLSNLSRTNPVVYNGRELSFGERQVLSDGDRVEMGEVVFNFRSR